MQLQKQQPKHSTFKIIKTTDLKIMTANTGRKLRDKLLKRKKVETSKTIEMIKQITHGKISKIQILVQF